MQRENNYNFFLEKRRNLHGELLRLNRDIFKLPSGTEIQNNVSQEMRAGTRRILGKFGKNFAP